MAERDSTRRCANCSASSSDTKLRLCAKCRSVYFCSQACIKEKWPQHKAECRRRVAEAAAAAAAAERAPAPAAAPVPAAAPAPESIARHTTARTAAGATGRAHAAACAPAAGALAPSPAASERRAVARDVLAALTSDILAAGAVKPPLRCEVELLKRACNALFSAGDAEAALDGYNFVTGTYLLAMSRLGMRPIARLDTPETGPSVWLLSVGALEPLWASTLANRVQALLNLGRHEEAAAGALHALRMPGCGDGVLGESALRRKLLQRLRAALAPPSQAVIDAAVAAHTARAAREGAPSPPRAETGAALASMRQAASRRRQAAAGRAGPDAPWSREAAAAILALCDGQPSTAVDVQGVLLAACEDPGRDAITLGDLVSGVRRCCGFIVTERVSHAAVLRIARLMCPALSHCAERQRAFGAALRTARAEYEEIASCCARVLHPFLISAGTPALPRTAAERLSSALETRCRWLLSGRYSHESALFAYLVCADRLLGALLSGLSDGDPLSSEQWLPSDIGAHALRTYIEEPRQDGANTSAAVATVRAACALGLSGVSPIRADGFDWVGTLKCAVELLWIALADAQLISSAEHTRRVELAREAQGMRYLAWPSALERTHRAAAEVDTRSLADGTPRTPVPLRHLLTKAEELRAKMHEIWRCPEHAPPKPTLREEGVLLSHALSEAEAAVEEAISAADAAAAAEGGGGAGGRGGRSAADGRSPRDRFRARWYGMSAELVADPAHMAALQGEMESIARGKAHLARLGGSDSGGGGSSSGSSSGAGHSESPLDLITRALEWDVLARRASLPAELPVVDECWYISVVPAQGVSAERPQQQLPAAGGFSLQVRSARVYATRSAQVLVSREPPPAALSMHDARKPSELPNALAVVPVAGAAVGARSSAAQHAWLCAYVAHAACRALLDAAFVRDGLPARVQLGSMGCEALHSAFGAADGVGDAGQHGPDSATRAPGAASASRRAHGGARPTDRAQPGSVTPGAASRQRLRVNAWAQRFVEEDLGVSTLVRAYGGCIRRNLPTGKARC